MQDHETKIAAAKMGVGLLLAGLSAITLSQVLTLVSILYFLLQIGLLLPKYRGWWGRWRAGNGPSE